MSTTWNLWRVAGASAAVALGAAFLLTDNSPQAAEKAPTAEPGKVANTLVRPGDCNQFFGGPQKNNVVATAVPAMWNLKTGKGIKWVSQLGSQTYGNPVVANGKCYVGSNNGGGWLKRYPGTTDLGVLLCFDEKDGKFLWQHSSEKLPTGRVHDWPLQGICCAPLIEGDRAWFVTSRGEVKCLDTEGFHDGEDDGPVKGEWGTQCEIMKADEPASDKYAGIVAGLKGSKVTPDLVAAFAAGGVKLPADAVVAAGEKPNTFSIQAKLDGNDRVFRARVLPVKLVVEKLITPADKDEADVVWSMNMMTDLGTSQHNMCSCSVATHGNWLFVNTSNGVDEGHLELPAPRAPTFLCLEKSTGKLLWSDNSPGANVLHGQWSSPAFAEIDGVPQVLFGGGDGWLYSFDARGDEGKPLLLWKFDCNPKKSKYLLGGRATRNHLIGTPVIHNGLVFIGVGEDPEHGEGEGHLWCIDPKKRGDVSPSLVFNKADNFAKPIPHKRLQACEEDKGDVERDNPNSAAVWHYTGFDTNGNKKQEFEESMHRTCGTVAIKDDILYVADFSGLFHCLDAKTGKQYWTHDMLAASWASPLIAGDHVYIGDEDGDICVFKHGKEKEEPEEINMLNSVYTTPIVAGKTLYIANKTHLFAIEEGATLKDIVNALKNRAVSGDGD